MLDCIQVFFHAVVTWFLYKKKSVIIFALSFAAHFIDMLDKILDILDKI